MHAVAMCLISSQRGWPVLPTTRWDRRYKARSDPPLPRYLLSLRQRAVELCPERDRLFFGRRRWRTRGNSLGGRNSSWRQLAVLDFLLAEDRKSTRLNS